MRNETKRIFKQDKRRQEFLLATIGSMDELEELIELKGGINKKETLK